MVEASRSVERDEQALAERRHDAHLLTEGMREAGVDRGVAEQEIALRFRRGGPLAAPHAAVALDIEADRRIDTRPLADSAGPLVRAGGIAAGPLPVLRPSNRRG